ncbi:MAG: hypothetical protein EB121_06785 [Alphaproteobacteria bacterium]|nr:hypothetical protein [Alphaproteobacteria bacterium]
MTLKRPVTLKQAKAFPAAAKRRKAFCLRMTGMKKKLTGAKKAKDPNSRINRALAAWDCDLPPMLPKKAVSKNIRPKNPVPPSSKAGMVSFADRDAISRAADLYQRFSGHDAEIVGKVRVNPMPKVGVAVGEVDGILYTTVRDGVLEKYIHKFRKADKPLFVVSPDGKSLHLVGGNYTFTERGIVDDSDPTR